MKKLMLKLIILIAPFTMISCSSMKSEEASSGVEQVRCEDYSKTPSRSISSLGGEEEIIVSTYDVKDPQWGNITIKVLDYGHPTAAPYELEVYLKCKDQNKSPSALNVPKEVLVSERGFKVCEMEGHKYDRNTKVLTINYRVQSEEFDPNAETCNQAMSYNFDFKKLCKKWVPRKK